MLPILDGGGVQVRGMQVRGVQVTGACEEEGSVEFQAKVSNGRCFT